MQSFSQDGNFIIAMPCKADENGRKKVTITAREGKKVTLYDVAETIRNDCFEFTADAEKLELDCHVIVGEREYNFTATWWQAPDDYLKEIAGQFNL